MFAVRHACFQCAMRVCREARRSRKWNCAESGSCTSVSTSVFTLTARHLRALEMYSADMLCVVSSVFFVFSVDYDASSPLAHVPSTRSQRCPSLFRSNVI